MFAKLTEMNTIQEDEMLLNTNSITRHSRAGFLDLKKIGNP